MEKRCPVFLSSVTLCGWGVGLPYRLAFQILKRFGFDGIEILLTRRAIRTFPRLRHLARRSGLKLAFHRWWHGGAVSSVLTPLGIFPKRGVRLGDVLPPDFPESVVVSSYNWKERHDLPQILIQPACTDPADVMPFEFLLEKITSEGTQLVFDVMHWLEYHFGRATMPDDSGALLAAALDGFAEFRQQIAEVHIYDFRLQVGPAPELLGSKLFPGDGLFPVKEFLAGVAASEWRGRIVWEINPILVAMRPWSVRRLKHLPSFLLGVGL